MNNYFVGNLVKLKATFSVLGVNTDPSAITLKVKDPTGAVTTVSTTKSATGQYYGTFTAVLAGGHFYQFKGTGVVTAAAEAEFNVLPSQF